MFSFGIAGSPSDSDKRFDTFEEAVKAAEAHQSEKRYDNVLAVWEDETGACLLIIYDGQWFTP